jgi:hypothetical protein
MRKEFTMPNVGLIVSLKELPKKAQELINEEQLSYIDEFTFIRRGTYIEAWYAGEMLSRFNGRRWKMVNP